MHAATYGATVPPDRTSTGFCPIESRAAAGVPDPPRGTPTPARTLYLVYCGVSVRVPLSVAVATIEEAAAFDA